jgi:hypothetical protein
MGKEKSRYSVKRLVVCLYGAVERMHIVICEILIPRFWLNHLKVGEICLFK